MADSGTDSHLAALSDRLGSITTLTRAVASDTTPTQRIWKRTPQEWSVAECFEHLVVTGGLYYPLLRGAIERTAERGLRGGAPYRPSWLGRFFLRFLDPESTKKLNAPARFRPTTGGDPGAIEKLLGQEEELATLIRDADGLDLNRVKFPSPVSRLIRFTVGDGLTIMVAHQERHLQQVSRIREEPEFPA